ncbi:60S RIBOSOMAL PROTEIN L13A (L16) [Encephalitozoon cuniculi GB-M1]|uniref:60S RIBOSOMAL PROTEIN L13A (L16) n=2 Tax=Encephalitozoon cuniculi TaxID=6035 RepID=Q8SS16_ENCCU|nr:60S ribosomal protein L16 [Encephalitozoon cuniculi GB-M1]7QEP_M6 Chain M6, 60S RIBOSOMAL PROTEIN L13A (L16) [Encephalitozoon cuniculi GB-M1]AGE95303.1 60S ribosomal protein l13a [Encephalitozoon cuniculi]KMV66343.1 60S ribosomal protein L13a [Encephalitozoon cuniculi EcunIII-L]UYI27522.1 ribosomal protein L13A [Encephalitozoon cuniculi]CAD25327.1 60S RIBOSOMAL PROTEIN L13A (L16) [Encephalitozoon cuniculi GB-M1]
MEKKEHVIIDATGQVAGKLAAKVAKLLLEGVRVTVVCAEEAVFVGSLERAMDKFKQYLNKRCLVNPRRGPFHFREPRMHLAKIIRRMISYKKPRGKAAMSRLATYEGIPRELEGQPRYKVTCAFVKYTGNPNRYVTLGKLLSMFGWKHAEAAKSLTDELKERESLASLQKKDLDKKIEELKTDKNFENEVNRRLAMLA